MSAQSKNTAIFNDINKIRDEVIFEAGHISANIGLSKSMGQLYAALYLSREPLALTELARICRMSKGNASINIRRLEKWGAAKKVWGKESRKDYYEANRDILRFTIDHGLKVFLEILSNSESFMEGIKSKISDIEKSDTSLEKKEALKQYKSSVAQMASLTAKLKRLGKNLKHIEKLVR
jgi:DNA-binding transcriptional regulator GbsR (MarR family)